MEDMITIDVSCKDDLIKEKYTALAAKMSEDSEFQSKIKFCDEDEKVYALYKEYGYTDLSYEEFIVQFRKSVKDILEVQPKGTFELTQEELECIVGGFNFYKYFTAVISTIPVSGPFIAGVAKAFKTGMEGKDISSYIRQFAFGRSAMVHIK